VAIERHYPISQCPRQRIERGKKKPASKKGTDEPDRSKKKPERIGEKKSASKTVNWWGEAGSGLRTNPLPVVPVEEEVS